MDDLPLNLLLFPLVGGYYITTRLETAKFISQRLSSQAILFNAILVAMPLLAVSLGISTGLTAFLPTQVGWIKNNLFPIKDEFFGTCVLSLIIAYGFTKVRNWKIDEAEATYMAIQLVGNELELFFAVSCRQSQLIQITLKNDKVYIGWVKLLPKPTEIPYIQLLPLLSGYRDSSKEVIITTDYSTVYDELIGTDKIEKLEDSQFELVVNTNEVISASKFDYDVFMKFVNTKTTTSRDERNKDE